MILCTHQGNEGMCKGRNQEIGPVITGSEDEERWEGRSQERMKLLKTVCRKEKRDSGRAAATVNGTLRR